MRGSVIGLGFVCAGSVAVIYYVHSQQRKDIKRMQQSVFLDAERERFRRQVLSQRAGDLGSEIEFGSQDNPKTTDHRSQT
jgi:PET assembly of cytochrome c oxidase, mitochondrial